MTGIARVRPKVSIAYNWLRPRVVRNFQICYLQLFVAGLHKDSVVLPKRFSKCQACITLHSIILRDQIARKKKLVDSYLAVGAITNIKWI